MKSRNRLSIESMENIVVMAGLNLPAKDERYHKDWLLQNQARCIHLCLMKWLEDGTVSITQWCDWGGGGGCSFYRNGRGDTSLKDGGVNNLCTQC